MTWTIAGVSAGYLTLLVTVLTLWLRQGQKTADAQALAAKTELASLISTTATGLRSEMSTLRSELSEQIVAVQADLSTNIVGVDQRVQLVVAALHEADSVLDLRVTHLEDDSHGRRSLVRP